MTVTFHDNAEAEAFKEVPYAEAAREIDALAGRGPGLGGYILGTVVPATRRRTGREGAYVACARGAEKNGFVVRVHR